MSTTVTPAGGGMFFLDGGKLKVDLGTLMLTLNIARTDEMDKLIADTMTDSQEQIRKMKALNALMAHCRENKSSRSSAHDDNSSDPNCEFTLPGYEDEGSKSVYEWFSYFGMTEVDVNPSDSYEEWCSEWDSNIQTIKGVIDAVNSDSQNTMTQLQARMNKRNQCDEMSSNVLQKAQKPFDTIVGNIR